MTPAEFEDSLRKQLTIQKLRSSVTDWLSVADKDLEQEYRRKNDKVKLAVVTFTADSFRKDVNVSDADVASYFDAHKDDFKIGEKRKIRYLLIDIDALRQKVVVPSADIDRVAGLCLSLLFEIVELSERVARLEGADAAAANDRIARLVERAVGRP